MGQDPAGIGTNEVEGDGAGAQHSLEECQESRMADENEISPVPDEAEQQDMLAGLVVVDDEEASDETGHIGGDFFEGIEEGGNDRELYHSSNDDLVGSFLAVT